MSRRKAELRSCGESPKDPATAVDETSTIVYGVSLNGSDVAAPLSSSSKSSACAYSASTLMSAVGGANPRRE